MRRDAEVQTQALGHVELGAFHARVRDDAKGFIPMIHGRLLRVCIATAAAALLCACGTGQPLSTDEPAGIQDSDVNAPVCAELVGQKMPTAFAGCETSTGDLAPADELKCGDGRMLITTFPDKWEQADQVIYGFVGEPIAANVGDGEMMRVMAQCSEL